MILHIYIQKSKKYGHRMLNPIKYSERTVRTYGATCNPPSTFMGGIGYPENALNCRKALNNKTIVVHRKIMH